MRGSIGWQQLSDISSLQHTPGQGLKAYAWSRSESRSRTGWKFRRTPWQDRCTDVKVAPSIYIMRKSVNVDEHKAKHAPNRFARTFPLVRIWISASLLRTEVAHGILPCSWPVPCPFDCMVILNFWASKFCFLLMPLTSQSKRLDATCWKQLVFTLLVSLLLRRDREGSKIHINHSWLGSTCCSSKCMRELRQIKTWDHTSSSRCLLDEELEWQRMDGKKRKTLDH